jgi:hypothetical protein
MWLHMCACTHRNSGDASLVQEWAAGAIGGLPAASQCLLLEHLFCVAAHHLGGSVGGRNVPSAELQKAAADFASEQAARQQRNAQFDARAGGTGSGLQPAEGKRTTSGGLGGSQPADMKRQSSGGPASPSASVAGGKGKPAAAAAPAAAPAAAAPAAGSRPSNEDFPALGGGSKPKPKQGSAAAALATAQSWGTRAAGGSGGSADAGGSSGGKKASGGGGGKNKKGQVLIQFGAQRGAT